MTPSEKAALRASTLENSEFRYLFIPVYAQYASLILNSNYPTPVWEGVSPSRVLDVLKLHKDPVHVTCQLLSDWREESRDGMLGSYWLICRMYRCN